MIRSSSFRSVMSRTNSMRQNSLPSSSNRGKTARSCVPRARRGPSYGTMPECGFPVATDTFEGQFSQGVDLPWKTSWHLRPTMGAAWAYQRSMAEFTPRIVKSRSRMLMPSGEPLKR